MPEEEKQISKHSGSVSIIIRLDGLWKDVNLHARANNYAKWNADLDRVWCELARDLPEKEYETKKQKFDEFDVKIAKTGGFQDEAGSGFNKLTDEQIKNRSEQYGLLMSKELFLRRLENELGKGTAYQDEDDFDLD